MGISLRETGHQLLEFFAEIGRNASALGQTGTPHQNTTAGQAQRNSAHARHLRR